MPTPSRAELIVPGPQRSRQEPRTSEGQLVHHGGKFSGDRFGHGDLPDGHVRILQAVPGKHADHPGPGGGADLEQPATDAADAGSQNTDSSLARNR